MPACFLFVFQLFGMVVLLYSRAPPILQTRISFVATSMSTNAPLHFPLTARAPSILRTRISFAAASMSTNAPLHFSLTARAPPILETRKSLTATSISTNAALHFLLTARAPSNFSYGQIPHCPGQQCPTRVPIHHQHSKKPERCSWHKGRELCVGKAFGNRGGF